MLSNTNSEGLLRAHPVTSLVGHVVEMHIPKEMPHSGVGRSGWWSWVLLRARCLTRQVSVAPSYPLLGRIMLGSIPSQDHTLSEPSSVPAHLYDGQT
jgi:hypothetical protein